MICLYLNPEDAAKVAIEASDALSTAGVVLEPADRLHITLAYFPEVTPDRRDTLIQEAAMLACCLSPISTGVEGVGRFNSEDVEGAPIVLLVDPTQLVHTHDLIAGQLYSWVSRDHGFIPHITLAYAPDGASLQLNGISDIELTFDKLSVVIGGERHDFNMYQPLSDMVAASPMYKAVKGLLQASVDATGGLSKPDAQPPVVSRQTGEGMKATVVINDSADSTEKAGKRMASGMRSKLAAVKDAVQGLLDWASYSDAQDDEAATTAKETKAPEPVEASIGRLLVFKDASGEDRWLSISTSAFEDRDNEIIPTALIERDIERSEKADKGPLRIWHIPDADIGDCDFQGMEGRFLIESGTFRSTPFAVKARDYLRTTDEDLGVSVGFLYPKDHFDGRVYGGDIHITERSILPRAKAAHGWTNFVDVGEVMKPAQKAYLEQMVGADLAAAVISRAAETTKDLEGAGVAFKNADGSELTLGQTVAAIGEVIKASPSEAVKEAYVAFANAVKESETTAEDKDKGGDEGKKETDAVVTAVSEMLKPIAEATAKSAEAADKATAAADQNAKDIAALTGAVKSLADVIAAAKKEAEDDSPRGKTAFRASTAEKSTVEDQIAQIIAGASALNGGAVKEVSPEVAAASPYVLDILGGGGRS